MIPLATVQRDLLILTCAISAGIHAALVPEHFAEGAGAGGGFVASVVLLAGDRRRADPPAADRLDVYSWRALSSWDCSSATELAVTTGVPVLHPDVEPVEALALATKAIEASASLAALLLIGIAVRPYLDPRPTERNIDMSKTRNYRPVPLALVAARRDVQRACRTGRLRRARGNGPREQRPAGKHACERGGVAIDHDEGVRTTQ